MLNDRDDKYENPEESEYHFSDEEVNYEVETESPKGVPVAGQKESVLNRLTRSKRMLISLGVFLVLVFVVYKMVAPSSTPQTTDITSPVVTQSQSKPMTTVTQVTTTQQAPVLPVATTNNMPPPVAMTTTTTQAAAPQMASPVPVVQTQTTTQTPASQPVSLPQMQVSQVALPVQTPPQMQAPAVVPAEQSMLAQQTAATPSVTQTTTTVTQPSAMTGVGTTLPVATDSRVATLAAENQKLADQLQQEYAQKINDYASQNRALQDQVQTLNTRVASMETQMNQLVQALTRQTQGQNGVAQPAQQQGQQDHSDRGADVKVPYSVQAIIPGRAWLRSDNGETVTVAEGDMVKDIGRVTKIDPYDGVVEINTGSKTVSLSYGNGS